MLELGLNSESINYEVALEILGQNRQPFMAALLAEQKKPVPSAEMLEYCKTQLAAIDALQDNLKPTDTETIMRILKQNDPVFIRK